LSTGDLIMCSSYEPFSRLIKFFSYSNYSHAALVVVNPSRRVLEAYGLLPPSSPRSPTSPSSSAASSPQPSEDAAAAASDLVSSVVDDGLYVLDSDTEFFDKHAHVERGDRRHDGVQLTPMRLWLQGCKDIDGDKFVVVTRHLNRSATSKTSNNHNVSTAYACSSPALFEDWLVAMSDRAYNHRRRALAGSVLRTNIHDDQNTLFCSELVAAAFQALGCMDLNVPASNFIPRDFSMGFDSVLNLQNATLGDETRVIL